MQGNSNDSLTRITKTLNSEALRGETRPENQEVFTSGGTAELWELENVWKCNIYIHSLLF